MDPFFLFDHTPRVRKVSNLNTPEGKWNSLKGPMRIADMATSHVRNAMMLSIRKGWVAKSIELEGELERRLMSTHQSA